MENEEEVLFWIINQKQDESIEDIDRDTLFKYINAKDFLAVVFCKCYLNKNIIFLLKVLFFFH